jgi:polyferredoxin
MQTSRVSLDLLKCKPVHGVVKWPWFPLVLQLAALGAVLALAAVGLGIGLGARPADLMILRKTNITTLVVWGIWWPSMIAVAVTFGRVWCTVCPMELVNRAADALARTIGWRRLPLGRILRAGWAILLLYLVLQVMVAGLSIHRVPHYTALFLLLLIGVALATGLVFRESRSFCRAFCPAGALLSVYGRNTSLQLETRDASMCAHCPTKDCIRAENRYRFDKRSCPSQLRPFHREPSDGCVLCLQCAKVCPYGNVGLGLVSNDTPVRRKSLLRPYEAVFVMVALGFVSHEVVGEVKWLDKTFHAIPALLARSLPTVSFGWFEAIWFLLLFPLLVWSVIAAAAFLFGHRGQTGLLLIAAATGAAPVVAMAHLAKAAAKLTSWGGFLPMALTDPHGLSTMRKVSTHAVAIPPPMIQLTLLGWLMLALVVIMAVKVWRWRQEIPQDAAIAMRAGLAGAALLFTVVLTTWTWTGS